MEIKEKLEHLSTRSWFSSFVPSITLSLSMEWRGKHAYSLYSEAACAWALPTQSPYMILVLSNSEIPAPLASCSALRTFCYLAHLLTVWERHSEESSAGSAEGLPTVHLCLPWSFPHGFQSFWVWERNVGIPREAISWEQHETIPLICSRD